MDPITLILTALVAGASMGVMDELKGEVKEKVKAAHARLRDLASKRFRAAGIPNAEAILAEYEADPESYKTPLAKKLGVADAGKDDAIVAAAKAVLELLDQGLESSMYTVTVTDSKGVVVGDGNTQTNTFTS
jgi:hypothetical protein